jgi:hypothetical protein
MAAPKKVDYESIEPGWRAGAKSPAQLAAEYTAATGISVSHTAIIKHFKKVGVPRDLGAKVKAKADAMVLEAMVTGKVSTETTKTDAKIIADNAAIEATVRIEHRKDAKRARTLVISLLGELEGQTANNETLVELGEMMRRENDNGVDRLNDTYNKIISSAGRIDSVKKLTEALKNLIGIEREAYGLDQPEKPAGDLKDLSDTELEARIRDLESRARPNPAG